MARRRKRTRQRKREGGERICRFLTPPTGFSGWDGEGGGENRAFRLDSRFNLEQRRRRRRRRTFVAFVRYLSVMGCRDARDLFLNDFAYRRPTTAEMFVTIHATDSPSIIRFINQLNSDPTFFLPLQGRKERNSAQFQFGRSVKG